MNKDFIMEMLYISYLHTYRKQSYIASSNYYQDLVDKGLKGYLQDLYIYDGNDLDDWFIFLDKNKGSDLLERYRKSKSEVKVATIDAGKTKSIKNKELKPGS